MKPSTPEGDAASAARAATSTASSDGQQLAAWLGSVPGRYLLGWEQACFDTAVADCFGYHALQIGLPQIDALRANRMPRRWLALPEPQAAPGPRALDLVTHAAALPFSENTLDLIALPHTLEFSADPHAVLREAQRVLLPEGRLVLCGLNPISLWGWRQSRTHVLARLGLGHSRAARPFLPEAGEFIAPWRLRDWLHLLGFEVESCRMGCFRPALQTERWMQRWAWIERAGSRAWPVLGAAYCLVAVKRVRGLRLLGPAWKPKRIATSSVAVAQHSAAPQAGGSHPTPT